MIQKQNEIRPVVYGISLYFLLSALDCFPIGPLGSILKIVALLPIVLMVFDLKRLRLLLHPLLIVQLLFWLIATVSLFHSIYVDKTVFSVLTLTLNLVLVFALGLMEQYNKRELQMIQKSLFWSGWITVVLLLFFSDFSAGGRLTLKLGGETQDQNYINGFFLYAFSCHLDLFLRKKRIHGLPALLILVIVLMTGSRGAILAYLGVIFAHACILFSNSAHRVRIIFLMAFFVAVILILFDQILKLMPESVAVRFSWDYLEEKGTTGRGKVWMFLLDHFAHDNILRMLFGHGYGTTHLVNQLNHNVAHNLYLDNLITIGIVGVFLQIATQGMIVWILYRRKLYALLGAYMGMIVMCMSLSLTAHKILWNVMLITLAIDCNSPDNHSE